MTIITDSSWSNIQCTPLYLLMGTVMGQGTDDNVFQKCIKKNTRRELQKRHIQAMQQNQNDVRDSTARMNALLDNNNNTIENKQAELLRLVDGANESVEESVMKQNMINQAIIDTENPLTDTIGKLDDIVSGTKDLYNAFTDNNSKIKIN